MADELGANDDSASDSASADGLGAVGRAASSHRGGSIAEIVHQLQAQAYEDAPWLKRQLDPLQTDAFIADTSRRYAEIGVDVPPVRTQDLDSLGLSDDATIRSMLPLQDPWSFAGMRALWLQVHELSTHRGVTLASAPLIGTLPTGEMNARALRHPLTGEQAILFDDEVRSLAFLMSKVCASILVSKSDEAVTFVDLDFSRARFPLEQAPGAAMRFTAILDSYLIDGWVRILPQWIVDGPVLQFALTLCEAFEQFVMAHEYGHLAIGHLDGAVHASIAGHSDLTEIQKQQAQEVEADAHGLRIACDHAFKKFGSPLPGFWGAYLACKTFEIIDRGVYAIATKANWTSVYEKVQHWRTETGSHPSAGLRAAMLCQMMADTPFESEALEFAAAIDILFEQLFVGAFPVLAQRQRVHSRFRALHDAFKWEAPRPEYGIL